jgi:hypothetical protein
MKIKKGDRNTYNLLKYKCEFLRRNPEYQKRYEEIIAYREKHNYQPEQEGNFLRLMYDGERREPYTEETYICAASGIRAIYMPNPNLT